MTDEIRARKLASILSVLSKSTGGDYSGSSFDSRFRIQKSMYLLKALGFGPASCYDFPIYIRGPYSKLLANDYYAIGNRGLKASEPVDIPAEFLAAVSSAFSRGTLFTEAVATLHSTWGYNLGLSKEQIFSHVLTIKPYLSNEMLEEAWGFIFKMGLAK